MAKDDIEVIMYKILEYLYTCMKFDREPDISEYGWSSKLMDISKGYWCRIIEILATEGFIIGFSIKHTKSGILIQEDPPIGITLRGRDYLRDNSTMQKVREMCGKAIEVVLSGIVGTVV